MSCSVGECGPPEPYRAAQAQAVAAIRRQFLFRDLPSCREGHGNPLAPCATTRSKAASIHYQSNNHAIPNTPSRACPISRKKIVKTLLNLAIIGPLHPKICLNADFPGGTGRNGGSDSSPPLTRGLDGPTDCRARLSRGQPHISGLWSRTSILRCPGRRYSKLCGYARNSPSLLP